jgi:hypothetical protein
MECAIMKMKIFIPILLCLVCSVAVAGEIRTTPQYIVLTEPTTNRVEIVSYSFYPGDNPRVDIKFNIIDSNGDIRATKTVFVQNALDDPETPENEASTQLTDFVAGYWTTLKSRGDTILWNYITSNYTVQDAP